MFAIVFGIHYNFFIVLPIHLLFISNDVFIFTRQILRAQKVGHISEVLDVWTAQSVSGAQFVQAWRSTQLNYFRYLNFTKFYIHLYTVLLLVICLIVRNNSCGNSSSSKFFSFILNIIPILFFDGDFNLFNCDLLA